MRTYTAYVINAYGVTIPVYLCKKGEGLPWHDHKDRGFGHGHKVITGSTLLERGGLEDLVCRPEHDNVYIHNDVAHQVTALEDGTIFINVQRERKDGQERT